MALLGLDRGTNDQFEQISTGMPDKNGQAISDITLPPDADTITVWFRHTGDNTSGVGFDWIKLKDVILKK
jgi:hypothetical protein